MHWTCETTTLHAMGNLIVQVRVQVRCQQSLQGICVNLSKEWLGRDCLNVKENTVRRGVGSAIMTRLEVWL